MKKKYITKIIQKEIFPKKMNEKERKEIFESERMDGRITERANERSDERIATEWLNY